MQNDILKNAKQKYTNHEFMGKIIKIKPMPIFILKSSTHGHI